MMNHFCKKFFTVYFTVTTIAMGLLSYGLIHSLGIMLGGIT